MKRLFTSFFILLTASGLWAQGPYDHTYTGSTLTVPDNQENTTFTSEINVTDSGTLEDLDVKFNMDSGNSGVLGYGIISPNGTSVNLKGATQGGSGAYYETIFDDEASQPISNGSAPYNGRFTPYEPTVNKLSDFDGQSIAGTWKLVIYTRSNSSASIDWQLMMNPNGEVLKVKKDGTGDYTTIQSAIDASIDRDTILVSPGTYSEALTINKDIVIASLHFTTGDTSYISSTIIDGSTTQNSYGRSISFKDCNPRISLQLTGFTIANGKGMGADKSSPELSYLRVYGHVAPTGGEGGGIHGHSSSVLTIKNSLFHSNKTYNRPGGGIAITDNSKAVIENSIIVKNEAQKAYCGGIWVDGSELILKNVTVADNLAQFINNIESDNGGIRIYNASTAVILNSIIKNNLAGSFEKNFLTDHSPTTYLRYTNVDAIDINGITLTGTGVISSDPLFNDPSNIDYTLSDYSPVIGAGSSSITIDSDTYTVSQKDYLGNQRPNPQGTSPDLGAYENSRSEPLPHNTKIYVSTDGEDEGVGLESSPFKTIQAAVEYSKSGDTIIVNEGTYNENLTFNKNIILTSNYFLDSDTSHISKTIIDGNKTGRVLKIAKDDNTAGIDTTAKIIGLTIQGGQINQFGQGIYIYNSSPIIRNNIIQHNKSAPTQNVDCSGGGIMIGGSLSNPIIEYNLIRFNEAFPSGGGIMVWLAGDATIIRRNQIYKNAVVDANNFGAYTQHGGGIRMHMGSLINNTIWDNLSDSVPNDLFMDKKQYLRNNIIGKIYHPEKDESEIRYNLSLDKLGGTENIQASPLFLDSLNNNFNLTFYSPAKDAGDPNFPKDPDSTRADIGALYFDNRDIIPPTVNIENLVSDVWLNASLSINWTTNDNFPLDTMKIKLEYSTDFSSGVWTKIADSLSNNGSYLWRVPNIPSDDGGIKITATDYGGNTAADSSKIKFNIHYPSVSLEQLSTDTVKISEIVPIKWSTALAPEVKSVDLYYTIDDGTNWKDLSLNEKNDGEYLWAVPNEPTTTAGIRIVAKEQFGYTDTAEVKGIAIEIEYPKVSTIYPHDSTIWWTTQEIKLKTNIILNPLTVNKNSVIVTSDQFNYSYSVSMNNDSIIIDFSSGLGTNDIISIKLDASMIKSSFGYEFDGNGDGTPGDDYLVLKKVFLPIDYNYDNIIDAQDVSLFIDYFKSNDLKWETAPVIDGTVPYVKILPDGKYDIDDMLTFVQFGNWYLQGASGKVADDIGHTPISLDTTIQSKDYVVALADLTKAIEVYVKYDPLKLTPIIEPTSGEIKLGHHDAEKGVISLIIYNPNDDEIRLHWEHLDKEAESDISVLTKTTDFSDQVTVKRSMLKVISVPNEFALHDNYPNPFNPTTTFKFDVPELSDITISIYNLLGQKVKTFNMQNTPAGYHSISWNAMNDYGDPVGAGVYLYQLRANKFVKTKKMVLLK